MFTDPNQRTGKDSPISIGEALDGFTHHRNTSNPFQPISDERANWGEEKRQVSDQMRLLKEQLDSEKTARIESQVRGRFGDLIAYTVLI